MFDFARSTSHSYRVLSDTEYEREGKQQLGNIPCEKRRLSQVTSFTICFLVLLVLGAGVVIGWHIRPAETFKSSPTATPCRVPALRREWRSLSIEDKSDYIDAVKCLRQRPSALGLNHTLFDDFAWIHKHFGEYCTFRISVSLLDRRR